MSENKLYGLIGEKLGHSFSKEIHESLADYEYSLCPLTKQEFAAFMERADFAAINVTIPYKESVIPYLAEVDPQAAAIGAVNTIVNRGGRLCGYNTDFDGVKYMLARHGIELAGRRVLVLGTGGTSKTVCAVAAALGAAAVAVVSRSGGDGRLDYAQAAAAADTQVIINTTPNGMYPHNGDAPLLDPAAFPVLEAVVDVVYNPLQTNIVLAAKEQGKKACGGLEMLVAQAKYAAELFTGRQIDDAVIDDIYRRLRRQKLNIALIGMPGSGKSTVGKLIAKKLGRQFIDTDGLIEQKYGISCAEIINNYGEAEFRARETEAVKAAGALTNAVIATGGGAPTVNANTDPIKQNSRIYYLDRAVSALATEGRPLSAGDLNALLKKRLPSYLALADGMIKVTDPENTAAAIIKEHYDENTCY